PFPRTPVCPHSISDSMIILSITGCLMISFPFTDINPLKP
ncbi:uncharacterized protein METZ01_LOCUS478712, partial [marine metagenome]